VDLTKATTADAGPVHGDKIVVVKVPSSTKSALIDKYATRPSGHKRIDGSKHRGSSSGASGSDSYSGSKPKAPARIQSSYSDKAATSTADASGTKSPTPSYDTSKKPESSYGGKSGYGSKYLERVHGRNDTLGPEVCVRAGLFRHPADCQKFYECYWDRWINQYTIHIFKCPVHLVYDDYITACNWPFDGPQCVPHEAVKLYPDPNTKKQ
jgi:hypothetical protein